MKRSSVALLVTVLLTALLGVTPASASSPSGHRTYAQATQAAPAAGPATRRSLPVQRQGPVVAIPGPAGMGRQATAAPQATLPAALAAVGTAWTILGPRPIVPPAQVNAFTYGNVSGRVTALAVDQSSPSTVYAGTAGGGVWKTIDAGTTWAAMTDGQVSAGIGAIGYLTLYPERGRPITLRLPPPTSTSCPAT